MGIAQISYPPEFRNSDISSFSWGQKRRFVPVVAMIFYEGDYCGDFDDNEDKNYWKIIYRYCLFEQKIILLGTITCLKKEPKN